MDEIYLNAIAGCRLIITAKHKRLFTGQVTGHCGNVRGNLTECACETLNRMSYPHLRHRYENQVILAAVNMIRANPGLNCLNLAIFASGGLHGELVLIFLTC